MSTPAALTSPSERQEPLTSEAASVAFERAAPVRSFPSYQGQANFPGLWWSATSRGALALVRDGCRARAVRTSESFTFDGSEGGTATVTPLSVKDVSNEAHERQVVDWRELEVVVQVELSGLFVLGVDEEGTCAHDR